MKSFIDFINENADEPKQMHQIGLNRSQLKSLHRHPSFRTYVDSPSYPKVYAKLDKNDGGPGRTRNVILTNSRNRHRMRVAITNRGMILGHSIYSKSDNPHQDAEVQWDHVKSVDGG